MAGLFSLLPGVQTYTGDDAADTVILSGTRTQTENALSYTYGVYGISTLGGNDIVTISNITGIDPAGVNPLGITRIDAGAGNDFVSVSSLTNVTLYGGDGADTLWKTDLRSQTMNAVENGSYSFAGFGARTPDGMTQDSAWSVFGQPYYDYFDGGAGNDIITTGNGPDWVLGGTGSDWISVGSGNNVVFAGADNDTIISNGLTFTESSLGSLAFSSTSVSLADGTNAIWGGDGDDIVTVSRVAPSSGLAAAVNGENGNDTIIVNSTAGSWITGGAGNDSLGSIDFYVGGNAYASQTSEAADTFYAENGDDTVSAGRGNDLLVGGDGHDWLLDGGGNDRIYASTGLGDDGETDRLSFDSNVERSGLLGLGRDNLLDDVFDFQPASRYTNATGMSDKIDVSALILNNAFLTYDVGNPFLQGELRLQGLAMGTQVEANHGGTWTPFLTLHGVGIAELDTTNQGNIVNGLDLATGGDFIWHLG